ncbi:MAG: hypothetical protein RL240_1950 [Planctomycetota bacterium]|jgi:type I restriction enzyme S subunit
MSNEWFFEKFALIADAPGAVARMRELVLLHAVQARLVPRNPNETPVSKLVEDLLEAKSVISKGIKNHKTDFAFSKDDALPFEIPTHWNWVRLCDIGQITGGHTPSKNNAKYWNGDVQWFTSKDIKSDELFESELKITHNAVNSPGIQLYPPGCLFMVARSGILKRTFPVAINRVPATVNQDLKVLRPFIDGLEQFLQIMFRGLTGFIISKLVKTGMTVQSLKYEEFANQFFPVPPLAEQKRIVAKVDELMGMCDELEAQQQERELRKSILVRSSLSRFSESPTMENLGYLFHNSYDIPPSELRKSILTLAVQGKLVPQDPKDEPAAELIDRLEHERASLATEQGVRLPKKVLPINDDSNPHALPETWRWSRIGQLALVIDYGTSQKANNDTLGVPVYRMGNIVGGRLIADGLKYVDPSIDDLPSLFLKTDDILFNRTNSYELVGKAGIFTGPDNVATFASYLIRIRLPSNFLLSSFFNIAMNAPYFRRTQIEPEVVQQCGQANFNGTKLASTIVPVPPLAEQHRIVAKVDQLMALVDELERQQAASREKASNLLDAIVHEMTSGG